MFDVLLNVLLNVLWATFMVLLAIGFFAWIMGALEPTPSSKEVRGPEDKAPARSSQTGATSTWRQNETVGEVSAAAQPVTEPALEEGASDSDIPSPTEQSAPSQTAEPSAPTPTAQAETSAIAEIPTATEAETPQELDLPLAASLTVSEVVHPAVSEDVPIQIPDVVDNPIASDDTSEQHDRPNLLQEIAHLEQFDHHQKIAQLAQYVGHPDPIARAAAVSALGDLAKKSHGSDREEAIALLNQFIHDADNHVRVQAAAALGEMPVVG